MNNTTLSSLYMPIKPPPNEWCPSFAHITLATSTLLVLLTTILMYFFWKNRETPAFQARQVEMTMFASFCLIISMILPIASSYNMCNYGELQDTLYINVSGGAIYTYAQWLILYRTWILVINWKMAICQIANLNSSKLTETDTIWSSIYKYFVTAFAIKVWYCILCIWIIIFILCGYGKFYFQNGFNGGWVMYIIVMIYSLTVFTILMIGYNMRDHFLLMREMRFFMIFIIVLGLLFIIVGEYLDQWAIVYTLPQIVQIKILLNVCRNGLSVIVLLTYPLFKFRYSFHGILVNSNLFSIADTKHSEFQTDSTNAINKNDYFSVSNNCENIYESYNHLNIDPIKYPSLLSFLSKNNKCYQVFKQHLVSCLAVECLLFFTEAQMFRLQLKLSIQANDDYNHSNKQQSTNIHVSPNNEQIEESELIEIKNEKTDSKEIQIQQKVYYSILRMDFFYLQKGGIIHFDRQSIKEKWLNIYENYFSLSSQYQVNVKCEIFEQIEEFKKLIQTNHLSVQDYIESFEQSLICVYDLMESLYIHYQISDEYQTIIKQQFTHH